MKKFLLSCMSLLAAAFVASAAEDVTFNVNDATDIEGTYVEEVPAEGSNNGTGAHYQPLLSLKLGEYKCEFAWPEGTSANSQSAYYYPMSGKEGNNTIRLYKTNVMTITAPAGYVFTAMTATGKDCGEANLQPIISGFGTGVLVLDNTTKSMRFETITFTVEGGEGPAKQLPGLAWSESTVTVEKGAEFTAPTLSKETTAAVTFESDNEEVATVSADGVIALAGGVGTAVITATAEENDEYYGGSASCTIKVVEYNVYEPAKSFEPGESYLIVFQRDDCTYYAYPAAEDKTHAYLSTGKIDGYVDEVKVSTAYDDTFTFEAAGNDTYFIIDCYDRYMYQEGTYAQFQLGVEEPAEGWTVTANADGTYEIAMNGYKWMFGQSTYTSVGCFTGDEDNLENAKMPMLYSLKAPSSSIAAVASDNDAPVVYYNLQGMRVGNPSCGIFVRVQGNTATKVLVK